MRFSTVALTTWLVAVVWTVVVGVSLQVGRNQRQEAVLELAGAQAHAHLEQDFTIRKWAAGHGGVYVPVDPETPPNPYLAHVPDRDLPRSGKADLTLMNPAYMLRQLYSFMPQSGGVRTRITSLNPLRPDNGPDAWEESALRRLNAGEAEVRELVRKEEGDYLRAMRPIMTEQVCLKCHGHQGYRKGEVRGGVAVSIPLQELQVLASKANQRQVWTHLVIWILGLMGTLWGGWLLRRSQHKQEKLAAELGQALAATDSIMENVPVGITMIGQDKVVRRANRAALEILGKSRDQVVGHICHENICPNSEGNCPVLDQHQTIDNSTRRALGPQGDQVPILKTVVPFQFRGEPVLLEAFIDIRDQAEKKRELETTVEELQRFNRQAVGRELRMVELKGEVNSLLRELERKPRYLQKETLAPEVRP